MHAALIFGKWPSLPLAPGLGDVECGILCGAWSPGYQVVRMALWAQDYPAVARGRRSWYGDADFYFFWWCWSVITKLLIMESQHSLELGSAVQGRSASLEHMPCRLFPQCSPEADRILSWAVSQPIPEPIQGILKGHAKRAVSPATRDSQPCEPLSLESGEKPGREEGWVAALLAG